MAILPADWAFPHQTIASLTLVAHLSPRALEASRSPWTRRSWTAGADFVFDAVKIIGATWPWFFNVRNERVIIDQIFYCIFAVRANPSIWLGTVYESGLVDDPTPVNIPKPANKSFDTVKSGLACHHGTNASLTCRLLADSSVMIEHCWSPQCTSSSHVQHQAL